MADRQKKIAHGTIEMTLTIACNPDTSGSRALAYRLRLLNPTFTKCGFQPDRREPIGAEADPVQ